MWRPDSVNHVQKFKILMRDATDASLFYLDVNHFFPLHYSFMVSQILRQVVNSPHTLRAVRAVRAATSRSYRSSTISFGNLTNLQKRQLHRATYTSSNITSLLGYDHNRPTLYNVQSQRSLLIGG